MTEVRVDVTALRDALDRVRETRGLSWRGAAQEIGVSASTMSRMACGQYPDVNAFARLARWLKVPCETFIVENGQPVTPAAGRPEPRYIAALVGDLPGGELPLVDRYLLIRDLHSIGWTDKQIATHTHGTLSSITAARTRLGLEKNGAVAIEAELSHTAVQKIVARESQGNDTKA